MPLETDSNFDIRPIRQAMIRRVARTFANVVRHSPFAHELDVSEYNAKELRYIRFLLTERYDLTRRSDSNTWESHENADSSKRFVATVIQENPQIFER